MEFRRSSFSGGSGDEDGDAQVLAFASLLQSVAAGDTAEGAPAQRPVAGIMAGGEFGREGPDSDDEDFASGDASAGRNTLGLAFSCVGAMLS